MEFSEQIEKLAALHRDGALTDAEFADAKKRLIDTLGPAPRQEAPRAAASPSTLGQLRRSLTDKWIGGVAGGLADFTGMPSWAWRILFLLTLLLNGLGLLVYILLWIFVPANVDRAAQPSHHGF